MARRTVLVVASGADPSSVEAAPAAGFVIVADGGLHAASAAGRSVDLVIGDLDSTSAEALAEATAGGIEVRRHPPEKDESDLELALRAALDAGADTVHVVLRDGGRLDHQLANLLVLASHRWAAARIDATVGDHRVWVIRGRRVLPLRPGAALALHAVGGHASGVTTDGLRYPLDDAVLEPLVAIGIANEVTARAPSVRVAQGVLLAISSPTPSTGPDAAR